MKKLMLCCVLITLLVGAWAAERVVVGELATSTTCGPCVSANNTLDALRTAEPYIDRLALIRYHAWWPSPGNDPFYLANTAQNRTRIQTVYAVTGVPALFLDGATSTVSSARVDARMAINSPMTIDLEFVEDGVDGGTVYITIESDTAFSAMMNLHCVLIEDELEYAAPNGQTVFYEVMRYMFPDENGQLVDMPTPGTYTYEQYITLETVDNIMNASVVVFLQNSGTKAIYQGAKIKLSAYSYRLSPEVSTSATSSPTEIGNFEFAVRNDGRLSDEYSIVVDDSELPTGWTYIANTSAGPFTGSTVISVLSGGEETINIAIDPHGNPGTGKLSVFATSEALGVELGAEINYIAGVSILIVDDDGGQNCETWFTASLSRLGYNYGIYNHASLGAPTGAFLSNFDIVMWTTGADYSTTFEDADAVALIEFLNNGGNLYMSSPELGYYVDEVGSAALTGFYNAYMKAIFVEDAAADRTVNGVSGDLISDGLSFAIEGGDGADNQAYPDVINLRSGANLCFTYGDDTQYAGLRYDSDTYKVLYTAFGFEGIATAASRDLFMDRILSWFGVTKVTESAATTPKVLEISARPNPFNSVCAVTVSLPSGGDVLVFDITGKMVKTLGQNLSTGIFNLTFDASELASGVYFVAASSQKGLATEKVLLLK